MILNICVHVCVYVLFAGWGYIVAFTKLLKIYQIYHNWILSFHHSLLFIPPFLEKFQQVSFFYLHMCVHHFCTMFTLPCPFPTSSSLPTDRTHSALLLFYILEFLFLSLLWWYWGVNPDLYAWVLYCLSHASNSHFSFDYFFLNFCLLIKMCDKCSWQTPVVLQYI
jgi:hypothetical protein